MTELLAPAGNFEKLVFAANFGADAVYFGLDQFSLRGFASNFSLEDAEKGISYLHNLGKKAYVTLNIFPFENEYDALLDYAKQVESMGADGLIVADIGVIALLTQNTIKTPIHVSTQANTLSPQTALVYKALGASRVNLARELSFEQVISFQRKLAGQGMETEVFVHGSVCFSYSGRCAISDYLTGRRANRGECTHPCRWKYGLVEEKRPDEYLPVFEDNRGLYLFNTRDLALFSYITGLADAGVSSLKIEGRMKSIHYIASVVSLYRRILDGAKISSEECLALLNRVKSRGYTDGFMKGNIEPEDYSFDNSDPQANATFIGCIEPEKHVDGSIMQVRNKTFGGDLVEILTPDGNVQTQKLPPVLTEIGGEHMDSASHGKSLLLPFHLPAYSIIRTINSDEP